MHYQLVQDCEVTHRRVAEHFQELFVGIVLDAPATNAFGGQS